MHKIFIITILSFIVFSCKKDEKQEIKTVFANFNKANMESNGALIYQYSNKESHIYYENLLDKVLKYDSIQISKLNLSDKINLLSARAVIKETELIKIKPKDFMIKMYTVVNTMDTVKINAIKSMQIKNIEIDNNRAKSEFAPGGRSLSPKAYLEFTKENEEWKYSLVSMSKFVNHQLNTICKQNGLNEYDFIKLVFNDPSVQKKKIKSLKNSWIPIIK